MLYLLLLIIINVGRTLITGNCKQAYNERKKKRKAEVGIGLIWGD